MAVVARYKKDSLCHVERPKMMARGGMRHVIVSRGQCHENSSIV